MNYCKECETCSGCLKGNKCLFDNPGGSGACIGAVSGQKQPLTPHKHAAVIKAWADGAEVQILSLNGREWGCIARPSFRTERQYRIKPEPKPDNAALIKAWADGAEIEVSPKGLNRWRACTTPTWDCDYTDFRIKPEPKPDWSVPLAIIRLEGGGWVLDGRAKDNIKLTYDGETGALKSAEVLK